MPRRAITSNLDALADAWAWTERDVVAHGLPLFHVHGLVVGILGPLRRGGTAMHLGRFSPEAVARRAGRRGDDAVRRADDVPAAGRGRRGSAGAGGALGRARLLVSGSAALPAAEHERLRRLTGRAVVERYGMTETLMNTAIRADGEPAPGTVGPPLAGVEVRLVDDDGAAAGRPRRRDDRRAAGPRTQRLPGISQPARRDRRGAARRLVCHRRHGDPTARRLHPARRPAGDRSDQVRRLQDRRRRDRGLAARASRRSPTRPSPASPTTISASGSSPGWCCATASGADEAELVDHVAAQLAPHKRPRVVRFLDDLPRNELGKVQKKRLAAPDRS